MTDQRFTAPIHTNMAKHFMLNFIPFTSTWRKVRHSYWKTNWFFDKVC
jgi:hypothetical protein